MASVAGDTFVWLMALHEGFRLPSPPVRRGPGCSEAARAWGIVGLATGILGFVILPILSGPVALVAGIVAIRLGNPTGWWGVVLGGAQLVYVAVVLEELF